MLATSLIFARRVAVLLEDHYGIDICAPVWIPVCCLVAEPPLNIPHRDAQGRLMGRIKVVPCRVASVRVRFDAPELEVISDRAEFPTLALGYFHSVLVFYRTEEAAEAAGPEHLSRYLAPGGLAEQQLAQAVAAARPRFTSEEVH